MQLCRRNVKKNARQDHTAQNHFQTSDTQAISKKDGGWRVICHLSAPAGHSVNDHINPAHFTLQYCTVDKAIEVINKLGPELSWAKLI